MKCIRKNGWDGERKAFKISDIRRVSHIYVCCDEQFSLKKLSTKRMEMETEDKINLKSEFSLFKNWFSIFDFHFPPFRRLFQSSDILPILYHQFYINWTFYKITWKITKSNFQTQYQHFINFLFFHYKMTTYFIKNGRKSFFNSHT